MPHFVQMCTLIQRVTGCTSSNVQRLLRISYTAKLKRVRACTYIR